MVTSPAASEAPLSEGGWPASSDVTWNHLDSASAVGMPLPQAAFPAGFQPVNPYQSLQTGGSDPYVLQISNGIWELQQQQQTNRQWMQQMTMAFQHVFGHGQQSSASPQVEPRYSRKSKPPRLQRRERKRRADAWTAAKASRAGQGVEGDPVGASEPHGKSDVEWSAVAASWFGQEEVEGDPVGATEPQVKSDVEWSAAAAAWAGQEIEGDRIGATESQCKSDVESWEMPEVEPMATKAYADERIKMLRLDTSSTQDDVKDLLKALEGAVKHVAEEMDEQRKQSAHLSEVVSALRKEMDEQLAEKDARAAQLESKQSVLQGFVAELRLEVGAMKKSLDEERQAQMKTMEAMTEGQTQLRATTEWVNNQLAELQRNATANMELISAEMATKTEVQEQSKDVDAKFSALKRMLTESQTQLKALQNTVEKKMTAVDEQLGQVREQNRKATAAQDAAVAQLRSEHDLQKRTVRVAAVELDERRAQAKSMATTVETMAKELGQTGGQIGKLSSAVADVDAKLNAVQVKTAAQTTVAKTTTNEEPPVDVRDVSSKLQRLQARNRHAFDVVVHVSTNGAVQMVLYDGSLAPAKTALKSNGLFFCEVADVAGLRRLVEETLASKGLEGARWLYATDWSFWAPRNLQPLMRDNFFTINVLQRFLCSRNARITAEGEIDNDN